MADPGSLPAWKRSKAIAGAMMLIKGYADPVGSCDGCGRALARADGIIDVAFVGREARYSCPHCDHVSVRPLRVRGDARA